MICRRETRDWARAAGREEPLHLSPKSTTPGRTPPTTSPKKYITRRAPTTDFGQCVCCYKAAPGQGVVAQSTVRWKSNRLQALPAAIRPTRQQKKGKSAKNAKKK